MAGYLGEKRTQAESTLDVLKQAVVYGSVLASYNVEKFSLERLLKTVTGYDIADRRPPYSSESASGRHCPPAGCGMRDNIVS